MRLYQHLTDQQLLDLMVEVLAEVTTRGNTDSHDDECDAFENYGTDAETAESYAQNAQVFSLAAKRVEMFQSPMFQGDMICRGVVEYQARPFGNKHEDAWRKVTATKAEPTIEKRIEVLKHCTNSKGQPAYDFRALYVGPMRTAPFAYGSGDGYWVLAEDRDLRPDGSLYTIPLHKD